MNSLNPALTRADYDALDAINWSKLRLIGRSPAHFKHGYGDDSSAFALGTACHSAILEPEKFAAEFTVYPGKVRRGKEWEAFEAEALSRGVQVLSRSEHEKATAMAASVRGHARASQLLSGGQAEVAMVWELAGFQCKGRADLISDSVIVDLKSTADGSPRGFARSCLSYGYLGQAAWYSDGLYRITGKRLPFYFVAVENSAPYLPTVYRVPDRLLERGRNDYAELLGRLDYCKKNNFWGGYSTADEMDLEIAE